MAPLAVKVVKAPFVEGVEVPGLGNAGKGAPELKGGLHDRGPRLGHQQGREFKSDWLSINEFDPSQPAHVRGWLENERRMVERGRQLGPRNPPGYVMGHGRNTPAREGFDYSSSRLQAEDLNKLEEATRKKADVQKK